MYKIKRQSDFRGVLRIEDGKNYKDLEIVLHITPDMLDKARKLELTLIELQKKHEKKEVTKDDLVKLGELVIGTFRLLLGDANTQELIGIYNEDYFGMFRDVYPYIRDVIQPKLTQFCKNRARDVKRKVW